jgi:hypothetical protein
MRHPAGPGLHFPLELNPQKRKAEMALFQREDWADHNARKRTRLSATESR